MKNEEIIKEASVNPNEKKPSIREQYLARMRERLGDETDLDTDPESRYGAFMKYDDEQQEKLKNYEESNTKLADIFYKNPKFAAMMSDVMKGEDASIAFVKYFGRDALDATEDEEKMKMITEANQEYLNRVAESEQLRKAQEENLQKSESEMNDFQTEKKLDDETFGKFIDEVYHVVERGLEGLIQKDFLEIFWKGLNYEKDVESAAITGEIEGRNQKIKLEDRTNKAGNVPNLSSSNLSHTGKKNNPPFLKKRDFFEDFPNEN